MIEHTMKALALIFEGFEELEAVAPFALLRRAEIDLTIASNQKTTKGCHNIVLTDLEDIQSVDYTVYDCLILPGGPHYLYLQSSDLVHKIVNYFIENHKIIAAICAAPTVLGKWGYLKDKHYTCFTSLNQQFGGIYEPKGVVIDDTIITAKSAAYAIDFAYAIIEKTVGKQRLESMQKRIYYEK